VEPHSGELVLTREEVRQERERRKALARRKAEGTTAGKAELPKEPAWSFSRAPIQAWAQALLDAGKDGMASLEWFDGKLAARGNRAPDDLPDVVLHVEPVSVPDGRGGTSATRILRWGYQSDARRDDIASDPTPAAAKAAVEKLLGERKRLLAFQAARVGVEQAEGDVHVREAGGFALGEAVRIRDDYDVKSYRRRGRIKAFDVQDPYAHDRGDGRTVAYVMLDMNMPKKVFPLGAVERIPKAKGKKAASGVSRETTEAKPKGKATKTRGKG
jgi:hypothetical protein